MAQGSNKKKTAAKRYLRTWIVVADGGHARILESGHQHSGVTVRLDISSDARLTAGKLASDRLPRMQESANSAHHSITPRLSLKENEKRVFAARLTDYLNGGIDNFDQLVVVAPMRFLNLVRETLPNKVSKKIAVMRSKDITWMTDSQVLEHLGPVGQHVRRAREGA